MILLVSGATSTLKKFVSNPFVGQLVTPRSESLIIPGLVYACDNSSFSGFNEYKFRRMLDYVEGKKPIFVTVPDVVGSARDTMRLFDKWFTLMSEKNLPLAYVLQDGQSNVPIPYDAITTVFIGGTNQFKLGFEGSKYITEAKQRQKWVHVGRVNSLSRIFYFSHYNVDSIDGSTMSIAPNIQISRYAKFVETISTLKKATPFL